ncbi:MAG TPA: IS66 family transposase [Acetobacteraceae bacterium]|nr:IS66 family transposase [Acetobacteraceae bacterium]
MPELPNLDHLSHAEKDALIRVLWQRLGAAERLIADLEAKLGEPSKTPDNSSVPPSKGQKPNQPDKAKRAGPRKGSLGREGGGPLTRVLARPLALFPDETITTKAPACAHCQAALTEADQVLHGRYDKIDLPVVRPVVTRVERYAGHCPCCGGVTLAPVPVGMEEGSPFSVNIVALAIYLRFTHAISYRRLSQLFMQLYALSISEGALDALLQRAKPCFDDQVAAILARLRRSRIVCSDETTVRIDGRTHWNWAEPAKVPPMRSIGGRQAEGFQNDQVVIHVVRNSRAASVVTETMAGHRPTIWVSDLYGAQQGHADLWQVCLAHQLRDCKYAIEAGDTIFAPRMKALLLRAVVLARRRKKLAESTRRSYQRRLDHELNAIMVLAPTNSHGKRLRKRYGKVRSHLFTFLEHPDAPPDNNGSERELRPTATYRKVTGGFRSRWGADLFAAVRSVVGTAARRGIDAYQAIRAVLYGESVLLPG